MRLYSASASFTRPNNTTAYAASKLVANNILAGNVTPLVFLPTAGFLLTAVKLKLSGSSSNTNAQFTVHLYQFSPTLDVGDGGTFQTSTESGYLGNVFVDCSLFPIAGTDAVGISTIDPNSIPIFPDTTPGPNGTLNQIYGLIRSESSYIPSANEVITVTLIGVD